MSPVISYSLILPLLITFFSLLHLVSAGCYWENGTDRNAAYNASQGGTLTSDFYTPCSAPAGDSASMCCAQDNDCQSNGLCWDSGYQIYWRESCSDQSWESPGCIKLFINGTGAGSDIVVTECGDGSFCYTNRNFDCCNAGEGVYIVDGEQRSHDYNVTSTSSSSTSTPSQTLPSTTTQSAAPITTNSSSPLPSKPSPASSHGLSSGARAGIGIGVALGVLLMLGLLAWILMRRRRSRAQAQTHNSETAEKDADPHAGSSKQRFVAHEIHSDEKMQRVEMPSTQPPMFRDGLAELGNTERG